MGTWSCSTNLRDYDALDTNEGGAAGENSTGGTTNGNTGGDNSTGGTTASGSGGGTPNIEAGGEGGQSTNTPDTDPESCTHDNECLSGHCRLSYRDRDGDGYGNSNEMTGRCDGTIPAGYASIGGDCCDDGGNLELAALIHPGQTEYFDTPALICGIAWDYDCNGTVDPSPAEIPQGGCANPGGSAPCSHSSYISMMESDCGTSRGLTPCTLNSSTNTCQNSTTGAMAFIRCR